MSLECRFLPSGFPGCRAAPTAPSMQRGLCALVASLPERRTRPANYKSHGARLPEARGRRCRPHVARRRGWGRACSATRAGWPRQAGASPRAFTPRNPATAFPIPSATAGAQVKLGGPVTAARRSGARTVHARVTRPHPVRALSEETSASPWTQHTLPLHSVSGTLQQAGLSPGGRPGPVLLPQNLCSSARTQSS